MDTSMDSVSIQINTVAKDTGNGVTSLTNKLNNLDTSLKNVLNTSKNFKDLQTNINKANTNTNISPVKPTSSNESSNNYPTLQEQLQKLKIGDLGDESYARLQRTITDVNSETQKYLLNSQNVLSITRKGTGDTEKYNVALTQIRDNYAKLGSVEEQIYKLGLQDTFDVDPTGLKVIGDNASLVKDKFTDVNHEMQQYALSGGGLVTVTRQMENGVTTYKLSLDKLSNAYQKTSTETENLSNASQKTGSVMDSLSGKMSMMLARVWIIYRAVNVVARAIGNAINKAAKYEESLNLFTVTMGDYADEAEKWADNFSDKLYLDPSNVKEYMGTFNSLAKGLGVASDKAYLMSKNLTQLTYDLASFRNLDVETAFQKIQSGISGEIEPLRNVGVALSEATLQQTLNSMGYKESVSDLDEATKAQLRYIQMLKSTTEWQTDMGRTLVSPANAIRVLKEQFSQLGIAIGQIFLPPLMAAIPYIMAITEALTALAKRVAALFGYEITPTAKQKTSLTNLQTGVKAIGDEADSTKNKLNTMLAPFDELNVVQNHSNSNKKGKGDEGISLDLPLPEYDALANLNDKFAKNLDKARENLKKILPLVIAIGVGFAAWKIATHLSDGIVSIATAASILNKGLGGISTSIKGLSLGGLAKTIGTIGAAIIGVVTALTAGPGLYKLMKQVGMGTRDANKSMKSIITTGTGFAASIGLIVGALTGFNPIAMIAATGLGLIGAGLIAAKAQADGLKEKIKGDMFGDLTISTETFEKVLNSTQTAWSRTSRVIDEYKGTLDSLSESFDDSGQHVGNYLYQMKLLGDGVDEDTRTNFKNSLNEFFDDANQIIDTGSQYSINLWTATWQDADNITEDEQKNILGIIQDNNKYVKSELSNAQGTITDIYSNAISSRGYLTDEEYNTIQSMITRIKELTDSQASQAETDMEYYKKSFNDKSLALDEESYKNYKTARDTYQKEQQEQISQAYNEQVNDLDKQIAILKDRQKNANDDEKQTLQGQIDELQTQRDAADKTRKEKSDELKDYLKATDDQVYANLDQYYKDTYKLNDEEGQKQRKAIREIYKDLDIDTSSLDKADAKIKKNNKDTTDDLSSKWKNAITDIGNFLNGLKRTFENFNPHLKTPHITWDSNGFQTSGALKKTLETLSLPTSLPKLNVNWYAQGGYPDEGELFFANENGPEMIGKIGNKTAVANNEQIATTLTNTLIAALDNYQPNSQPAQTTIYIGNKKVYEGYGDYIDSENDRYGTNTIRI